MVIEFSLAQTLGLVLSVLLPLLVGLVTKTVTDSGIKATLLAALAAITGFVTEAFTAVQGDVPFNIVSAGMVALASFLVGVGMHFGLWKPTGVSERLQRIGEDRH